MDLLRYICQKPKNFGTQSTFDGFSNILKINVGVLKTKFGVKMNFDEILKRILVGATKKSIVCVETKDYGALNGRSSGQNDFQGAKIVRPSLQ